MSRNNSFLHGSLRGVPAVLLIYVWVRSLTANPIGPYSLSLYQALPTDLIIALGLAGFSLLLISRDYPKWTIILASQFLVALSIVPSLQTAFLHFTTDTFMHIGRFKRILETGSSAERNLYPLLHWLSAILAEVTDLSPTATAIFLVAMLSALLGVLGILCVRQLALPKSVYPLAIFSILLAFTTSDIYNFASWGQLGRLFAVLTFLLLVVSNRYSNHHLEWSIYLLLVLTAAAFAHPLIALTILLILATITVQQSVTGEVVYPVIKGPVILLPPGIIVAYWLFNLPTFLNTLQSIIASLFLSTGENSSRLARRTGQLARVEIAPIDIAIQFLAQYGYFVIFLGSLLVLITLRTVILRNRDSRFQPFAITAILFWALGTVMFILPVPFGPGRFWSIAIILGVLVAVRDLAALMEWRPKAQTPLFAGSLIVLLIVAGIAAPTLYGSEISRSPSDQMTKSEYSAGVWLFNYENTDKPIQSVGTPIRNLISYQQTSDSWRSAERPQPHFRELREGSFEGYVFISPPAGQTYPAFYENYPETWDFTPEDYNWLENGHDTEKIYDSGDTSIYISSH